MAKLAKVIRFQAKPYQLKDWLILRLPASVSLELPSRGQVSVRLTTGGHQFERVLEPDGYGGHWLRFDEAILRQIEVKSGDTIYVEIETLDTWPEPKIPEDLSLALDSASGKVQFKWRDITPMARWEWVRWIGATANAKTRAIRIEKTISKLEGTHRRPCCFNLAACTEPYLSKSGRLIGVTR